MKKSILVAALLSVAMSSAYPAHPPVNNACIAFAEGEVSRSKREALAGLDTDGLYFKLGEAQMHILSYLFCTSAVTSKNLEPREKGHSK